MIATLTSQERVVYPVSDGKPVAETEFQFNEIMALVQTLKRHFAKRDDVYVCGNNFIYYKKGDPKACFSPDTYVVHGVSKKMRDCYKVWEEDGHVPSAVFEVTSRSTKDEDLFDKKNKCESIGVKEYFLYDPRGEYLRPWLRGFRLEHGRYVPIERDKSGYLHSEALDLTVFLDQNGLLRLSDPNSGKRLLRVEEELDDTHAEVARLKDELKRLKNK